MITVSLWTPVTVPSAYILIQLPFRKPNSNAGFWFAMDTLPVLCMLPNTARQAAYEDDRGVPAPPVTPFVSRFDMALPVSTEIDARFGRQRQSDRVAGLIPIGPLNLF